MSRTITFILVVLLAFTATQVGAQGAMNIVNMHTDDIQTIHVGDAFVVEIGANIQSPTYGFGFQLGYDPTILEPVLRPDTTDGETAPFIRGSLFPEAMRVQNTSSEIDGKTVIDVVYTLLGDTPSVVGEGNLGSIAFRVKREGAILLDLTGVRLVELTDDRVPQYLPVNILNPLMQFQAQSNTVVDMPPPPSSRDYTPYIVIIFIMTILLIVGLLIAYRVTHQHRGKHQYRKS